MMMEICVCDVLSATLCLTLIFSLLTGEWNASGVVKTNTMPTVLLRAGRVLEPIVLPKGNKKKGTAEKEKKHHKK